MEEKIDRIEKNINDLIEIVGAVKDNLEQFKEETEGNFEKVQGKIDGLQRAVDSEFGHQSAIDARVTKIEAELHL